MLPGHVFLKFWIVKCGEQKPLMGRELELYIVELFTAVNIWEPRGNVHIK